MGADHTPGPWDAVFEDGRWLILSEKYGHRHATADREADARLIAAAPDLYQALQGMLSDRDFTGAIRQARRALAKAEGVEVPK